MDIMKKNRTAGIAGNFLSYLVLSAVRKNRRHNYINRLINAHYTVF